MEPLPPLAAALSFIDRINHRDLDGLVALMAKDHTLKVLDEAPTRGRTANARGWHGYFDAFPAYVIYPARLAAQGERVAILGHTTGSHLGLPDDEEIRLAVIWIAEVRGLVRAWSIVADTPTRRVELRLDGV